MKTLWACLNALLIASALAAWPSASRSADFKTGLEALAEDDYEAAINEFEPLAEEGDAEAQYMLGVTFSNRKFTHQDEEVFIFELGITKVVPKGTTQKAFMVWLAEQEEKTGQELRIYWGVFKPEMDKVAYWYRKAALQGHVGAQYELAGTCERNPRYCEEDKALVWYKKAAEAEISSVHSNLLR